MPLLPEIDLETLKAATPAEQEALLAALEEEVALQSPADYAAFVDGENFKRYPHSELISETIRAITQGELLRADGQPYKRLLITMPPQHGKSEMTSRYATGWFIAKWPKKKVILASYEAEFAMSWGRKSRDLLLTDEGKRLIELRRDVQSQKSWETIEGGGMITAGAGGAITGKGAHLMVIDDPFKGAADANSELTRQSIDDWYQSVVIGRIRKGAVIILIQTRWHEDDLAGRLLSREPEDWYVLNLPAIAVENDAIGRSPGEALCPDLFPLELLYEKRKSVSPYWWAAMYQQDPQIEGGGIFQADSFKYYTEREHHYALLQPNGAPIFREKSKEYRRFTTADTALTAKTYSDYTVLVACAFTEQKELLILDVERVKTEGINLEALIDQHRKKWKPDYVAVEKATGSLTLIQTLRRKLFPFKTLEPDKDKVSRAMEAQQMLYQGKVYFPRNAPWLADFEKELLVFDHGTHDDQVDAFSYACLEASRWERGPVTPRKREPQTIEEKCWAQIKERREAKRYDDLLGDW